MSIYANIDAKIYISISALIYVIIYISI